MDKLISLCMITKNESLVLSRCLESVKSLVDEIIIVDTGSTDTTVRIAAEYTNRVYHFAWCDDFAAARNESIRHAAGKWILILDADEYVQAKDHDNLRRFLQSFKVAEPCGFILPVMNFTGSGFDETNFMESSGARLFANHQGIHYIEPIHEQLICKNGKPTFAPFNFTIFHTGYTEQTVNEKNKSKRNLSILESAYYASKQNDPYFCFVLGNEYANASRAEEASAAYHRSLAKSKQTDTWYSHLLDRLITLEIQRGSHAAAHAILKSQIKRVPDKTDYYCLQGILYESTGFLNAASEMFTACIAIAEQAEQRMQSYWVVQPTYGKIIPHQMLAEIKRRQGDLQGAVYHWVKTLQLQPKNYAVLQQLIDHLLLSESTEQVRSVLERIYPVDQPVNILLLFKLALQAGDRALSAHYGDQIEKLGIQLDLSDTVMHAIVLHAPGVPPLSAIKDKGVLPPPLAAAAAIINNDLDYAELASGDPLLCKSLTQQLLLALNEEEWEPAKLYDREELAAQVLQLLWRCGYTDTYMSLLQTAANAEIVNLLADWFHRIGQVDQAIDLYGLLLDNNALSGEGLKSVGLWYIAAGNKEEGCSFLRASFDADASMDIIGLMKETASASEYREFSPVYLQAYPRLSKCVFI